VKANIICRVTASFTGAPTTRAARTASTTFGRALPLEPKPPPTCSARTRTSAGSTPNSVARSPATALVPWVESQTVRASPSQTAVLACGSMGLLNSAGVE